MSLTQAEKERFVYGKVASLVSEIIIMKKGIIITIKRFTMVNTLFLGVNW